MSNEGFFWGIGQDKEIIEHAQRMLTSVAKGMETALARATNKTAQGTKTQMVKHTRARFSVAAGDVRKTLWVRKATSGGMTAEVCSSGRPLPLFRFKVSPKRAISSKGIKPSKRRRPRVSVSRNNTTVFKKAFVAGMKSGHVGVFHRVIESGKVKLKEFYGPSTPQMLRSKAVTQAIETTARDRFKRELAHQVEWILKKNGG